MSLPILMVTIVVLATMALSATIPKQNSEKPTESNVETFDSYAVQKLPQQLPLTIQLPHEEPGDPFYSSEPDAYLKAPQFKPYPEPDFYVPVPSEYLSAPTDDVWNPNNDPTFYYELPASITKENSPTDVYPKKFNKDIHSKSKPLSIAPKQVIALEPINEAQYNQRQKELYKTIEKLNKKENKKDIDLEKVPIRIVKSRVKPQNSPKQPKDSGSDQTKLTKSPKKLSKPFTPVTKSPMKSDELETQTDSNNSETIFEPDSDTDLENYDSDKFTKGLSPKITDSLGLTSKHGAHGGQPERVLFHMVGHDGPMSYKWGYDTGKG